MTKDLILLGSTGSIGTQALEVARQTGIKVTVLTANKNIDLLEKQAREFKPLAVAVADSFLAEEIKIRLKDTFIKVYSSVDGIIDSISEKGDTVLNAIVGIAGLRASLEAIRLNKTLALANKESLVTGGDLIKSALKKHNGKMLPVDSEHSAIFQSLQGVPEGSVDSLLLTASGGPFFGKSRKELENVTVSDALNHPNWSMGRKITIDSATMMNKGLEVIEAVHLFNLPPEKINVVIQRESIIHSGIELRDGGVIVQMGVPDMKLPIQYALTYPNRYPCSKKLDLTDIGKLTFYKPDTETFRCLSVCIDAIRCGGLKPAAANGANEEAVRLFLENKIKFLDIEKLVEGAVVNQKSVKSFNLDDVFSADSDARRYVLNNYK